MKAMASVKLRLLFAFLITAAALLGMFWLVRNDLIRAAPFVLFALLAVDFALLKPRISSSTMSSVPKVHSSMRLGLVTGVACFAGSALLLLNGAQTRATWEIVLACLGLFASGLGIAFVGLKQSRRPKSSD